MRTQVALIAFAIATVAAFGLFASSLANAEQSAYSPFALLTGAQPDMTPFALVKGGQGGHHGGHHGKFHGGWYGRGFYGGYYPYYGSYYYNTSPNCVWNGYKFVCYDSSSDFYDAY